MSSSCAQIRKRKKVPLEIANPYDDNDNENIDDNSSDDENVYYTACNNNNVCDDDENALQKLIKSDTDHWKEVLVRIVSVVEFLAKNTLTFRETNEKLYYEEFDGHFLGLIRMISEFDDVMQTHFWRVKDETTHCRYLSDVVQNELIETLASNVKDEIVKKIKKAKYFSVILDRSLDVEYEEQMSLIIRYVDVSDSPVKVEEVFLDFLVVEKDTSGLGLFNVLHDVLRSLDLDVKCLRGQGYVNMKGKHQEVQKRLLDISPKAFYMPCGCHSLNLVLCDMANSSCHKAKIFFGTCQTICDVLSDSSTKRWNVLLEYVDDLTLRSLSATCFESRIESVKAIKTQLVQIHETLMQLVEVCDDGKVYRDVESLLDGELSSFDFIVSLVIWHEILDKVDSVSKKLQSKDMLLDVVVHDLEGLLVYFEKYRESGFDCAIDEAKEIADKIGVEPKFAVKSSFSGKKQFEEIPDIEREQNFAQETFKTDYFHVLVDMTLSQLRTTFEQMKEFESIFGFLFDGRKLLTLNDEDLKRCCMNLEVVLTNGDYCDIEGESLFVELQVLQVTLRERASEKENHWTYIEIMEYANKIRCFPHVMIVYRILLTLPVTVASPERSFSKLELLKSYLRSTTSQERSNGLATLCMESKFLADVNHKQVIDTLASKNAQRYRFR